MRLEQVGQLHAAVLATGANCFELKKLCATVVVPAMVLIQNFLKPTADASGGFLDASFFVAGAVIVIFFWVADAVSFYYQATLRKLMDTVAVKWQTTEGTNAPVHISWPPSRPQAITARYALFNGSMYFYGALIAVDLVVFAAWALNLVSV